MTALPSSGSFAMVDPTHVAEVGPAAALLYARISWRASASTTGTWRATRRELRDETGLSEAMLRTAAKTLRDEEWVTAERTSADDSTLVWRPLCPADQHMDASAPPPGGIIPTPLDDSSISSSKTGETLTPTPDGELFTVGADAKKPASRRKPRTAYPPEFRPKQSHLDLAAELGVDLRVQGPLFQDHHVAKDSRFASWDAALNAWIRNAARWQAERDGHATVTHLHPVELPPPPRTDLYG